MVDQAREQGYHVAYSYTLQKMIPVQCLPSGHLAARLAVVPGSE